MFILPDVVFQVEFAAPVSSNAPLLIISNFVPLPSIFSPSSPKVRPTFAGILISVVAVKLISAEAPRVKFVLSPDKYSFPSTNCNLTPVATVTTPVCAVVPVTVKLSATVVSEVE